MVGIWIDIYNLIKILYNTTILRILSRFAGTGLRSLYIHISPNTKDH